MAKVQLLPWDPAEFLKTEEDVAAYLEAAREDGAPDLIAEVLNVVERARGSAEVAAKWAGSDGAIGAYIREETKKSLDSYRSQPNNLREDANQEEDTAPRRLRQPATVRTGTEQRRRSGGIRRFLHLD